MTPRMAKGIKDAGHMRPFLQSTDDRGGSDLSHYQCGFVHNAQIVTTTGSKRIQDLRPEQHVISRGNGAIAVQHIEVLSIVTRAVYILAGSLGHSRGNRDTMLPAAQTVLLRDWRAHVWRGQPTLILPASELVDGEFVRDLGLQVVTLYKVYCNTPQIVYADGLELGTADLAPDTPVEKPFN